MFKILKCHVSLLLCPILLKLVEVTVDTHTYKYTRLLWVDAYYGIHCKGSDMGVMYNESFTNHFMVKQLYYARLKAEITM